MTIVICDGRYYRPAGVRQPLAGERYVGKDGKVKTADVANFPAGDRLILRQIVFVDEQAIPV